MGYLVLLRILLRDFTKFMDSKTLMETYLIEVGQNGRLDLIKTIAQPDMIDEANRAFGGPVETVL